MKITEIRLKNLRCFADATSKIRPITVIVGENSTGKTSFLSAYKLIHDLLYEVQPISPFSIEDLLKEKIYKNLGGPKNIIRKQDNSKTANLGATIKLSEKEAWDVEYLINEGKFCKKVFISSSEDTIEINIKNDMMKMLVNGKVGYDSTIPFHFPINFFKIISFLSKQLKSILKNNPKLNSKVASLIKFEEKNNELKNISCNLLNPVHLKPKTLYDPTQIKTTDSAYILCQMAEIKQTNKPEWEKISKKLNNFGKRSRLFQKLDIVHQGISRYSPFSIKVTVNDLESDITDVGYGISQVLPVLANIFIADSNKYNTCLIQQPEIHLHPRVESELTTLMINTINTHREKYHFICETHSDYIIQRARIEIQEGKLNPDNFLILYSELKNGTAQIHPITVDTNGNFENEPKNYKTFFLSEGYKLIGLKNAN